MISIPASWQPKGSSAAGPAGEGEVSNDNVFGVLAGISGLAGDVAGTINSLKTTTGKNGTPVNTPVIQPPNPNKERNGLLIGAAIVGALVLAWLLRKF